MFSPFSRHRDFPSTSRTIEGIIFFCQSIGLVSLGGVVVVTIGVIIAPSFSLRIGDFFFGDWPPAYHLPAAQFFYERAAYPMLRQSPAPYAHYQLARTNFVRGELYTALDEGQLELEFYPDHKKTYYIIGLTYGYLNRNYEAIDAFSEYIQAHPNTWAGRNDKAWLQFRLGDIDGAMATIEPIVENFRFTPWVQNTYCTLLINQNRLAEAEIACDNARKAIAQMTPHDWGHAYPGNDPHVYETGVAAMKQSIAENIALLAKRQEELLVEQK